jgi:hypothetical protein
MWKNLVSLLYSVFLISLLISPAWSLSEKGISVEDTCQETGIIVKNLTFKALWYKKNGGDCFYWRRDHIFTIYPGDKVDICSDSTCETLYCHDNPTYETYRSLDTNNNCRVRILPECTLSDM